MEVAAVAGSTPEEVLAMGATMEAREPERGHMEDEVGHAQTSEANIDGPLWVSKSRDTSSQRMPILPHV